MSTTEDRIINLETRSAEQQLTIDELSDMIAEQWKTIDEMKNLLSGMRGRIVTLEEKLEPDEADVPPPHY